MVLPDFDQSLFVPQKHEFERDYQTRMNMLAETVGSYQKAEMLFPARYHVSFGPTYHARTSKDIDCTIHTVLKMDGRRVTNFCLIAVDRAGRIIGYRKQTLMEESDHYSSSGFIYTAVRSKGISTAIDSAHADFLQRIATQYQRPVIWDIVNDNGIKLKKLQQAIAEREPDEDLSAILPVRVAEQDRWKAQYGATGRFGIKGEERRIIEPQFSRLTGKPLPENVELIENIFLTRIEGEPFRPAEIERIEPEERTRVLGNNTLFLRNIFGTALIS